MLHLSSTVGAALIAAVPATIAAGAAWRAQRAVTRNGGKSKKPTIQDKLSNLTAGQAEFVSLLSDHIAWCETENQRLWKAVSRRRRGPFQ
ncbi:hypothetical protein Back2_18020 [Nocardioides baekrokdamisoli]|uniref:Transposase n=1 Tax=Nocardioides baekrokdamisoli TaxID=1804624 RepID=A0A3G9INA1_9ACTN|nr:hypothetical protein [Nocardioides baekrokdamisoli]BBH17515.1 hypothetical protein Back2_18020 [Nocardioides baekrokdamisoli]